LTSGQQEVGIGERVAISRCCQIKRRKRRQVWGGKREGEITSRKKREESIEKGIATV